MTKRRLVAIMFTDIMGYTAMMQEDERATAEIRSHHRSALETFHTAFNGEIVQYYGDGSLSFFDSAVEAVECAIAIQKELQNEPKVPLRIGLHVGDIVIDGESIFGDGVNVAARIESMGISGNILLSQRLNMELSNHKQVTTKSLGFFEFKNVKTPVQVYAVTNTGIKVPERSELKGKLAQKKTTIAVLPFVNMSDEAWVENFCDGLTEETLNALVKVDAFQVSARTSSFAFKGKNIDVRDIGNQLNVSNVLEGSVRKSGNSLRITAQLINTVNGYHFFSETFTRSASNTFNVQTALSQQITRLIEAHLGDNQPAAKAKLGMTQPLSFKNTSESNDMKRCEQCGYMNSADKTECVKCGHPLSGEQPPKQQEEQPAEKPIANDPKKTIVGAPVSQPFLDSPAESPQSIACPKCSYPVRKNESFCPNCGAAINQSSNSKKTVALGDFNIGESKPSFSIASDRDQKTTDFSGKEVILNRQNLDEDNMTISGEAHAKFVYKNGQWYLSDMSSNNATFIQVNGELPINDGDMIILGQKIFRFKTEK
ncbi:MAG: adenylate/guanylate cyclase domain-containing protein [Bacteroidota bacterium]